MAPNFDLMTITGLRRKPKEIDKYARFNQRAMAMTLDLFLVLFLSSYLMEHFLSSYFPMPTVIDDTALRTSLGEHPGILQVMQTFLEFAWKTGLISYAAINTLMQTILLFAFSAVCWHYWAATPGKWLLRLRVVDAKTEAPITDRQIALRLFGYFIASITGGIGFLPIAFDKKRQGWHDKIAGTVVIVMPFPWRKLMWWKKPASEATPDSPVDNPSDSQAPAKAE